MFSTGAYRVFSGEPSERILSRPRRLVTERRLAEAEDAYRTVLATQPGLKAAWVEYFQLLRSARRFDESLELAQRAEAQFGDDALAPALKGAALVELGRFREGLAALEESAARDPDFSMVWHEAGYAAYRLGEYSRALMALDRAFALEPHSGTLHLRGKILRQAGRYPAAEVAFGGAAEASEFAEQRAEAERQIKITRRYAAFPGHRPDSLSRSRRWFAETGAVQLTTQGREPLPLGEADLLQLFEELVRTEGWRFTHVVRTDGSVLWMRLAQALDIPLQDSPSIEPDAVPLVVARRPHPGHFAWQAAEEAIAATNRGLTFVLHQPSDQPSADVAGLLEGTPNPLPDLGAASEAVQHPEGRLVGRRLT